MQVYIVAGGRIGGQGGQGILKYLDSTETLKKDGGSAWLLVANLPSGRSAPQGLGLDNGRFMITGEFKTKTRLYNYRLRSRYRSISA